MSYKKDTDYQAKINDAVKSGDYKSAAEYEKSRNEKIDSEGLGYEKTNRYSGWLDSTDYGTVLNQKMQSGATRGSVSSTLKKRINKASTTEGMGQYAYDDIYDRAIRYIMGGSFETEYSRPQYKENRQYTSALSRLMQALSETGNFSYNPQTDDLYKYYREAYMRDGKYAMEDTIGKAAANTGGMASSYALSAASQAYNYYTKKAADKIPELYALKYKEYSDEYDRIADEIGILRTLSNDDYQKYLDSEKRYESDRDYAYKKYTGASKGAFDYEQFERQKYESDRNYNLELEDIARQISDTAYEREQREYDKAYEAEKSKRDEALKKWNALGYLDEESARVLNLPAGLKTSDYEYKQAQKYKIYNK